MVGTAGWTIPPGHAGSFPCEGSHLVRYSQRLPAVEINSSFYRSHRPGTYARWAESVPEDFRFAVKMPREITHTRRLADTAEPLARFLSEVQTLGSKLGPVLVQLPPSLAFRPDLAAGFLSRLRGSFDGRVVLEPRHLSWFTEQADALLIEHKVGRVAADPAVVPQAAEPGGHRALSYYRLHGSPRIYYSAYSPEFLMALAARLLAARERVWCIFDNTAEGAAAMNALTVMQSVSAKRG